MKKLPLTLIAFIGIWLIGYITGRNHFQDTTKMVVQTDTLIRIDTVRIDRPAEVSREIITETDTLIISDTLRLRDTLYMVLSREVREYRDSLYYARISGINPSLDCIEVYQRSQEISRTETITRHPSPWHFSVGLGLDWGKGDAMYLAPNIGAEIGYKRLSFGAELGCSLDFLPDGNLTPAVYYQVGVRYNLLDL